MRSATNSAELATGLSAAAERFAETTALVSGDERVSYRELLRQAQSTSGELQDAGVLADEPVCLMVSNEPGDVAALLGIWLAGAVAVPVHRTSPAALREEVQTRVRCRFVVDTQAAPAPRASHAARGLSLLDTEPGTRSELAGAALIVFTSGSTGRPKGVVVGHREFAAKIDRIDELLRFGAGERTLLVLNITFSFGMWVSLLTLLRGGTLHMLQRFDPAALVEELRGSRITRVGMVPTMMRVLFGGEQYVERLREVNTQDDLRQIMMGGEALSLALATRIREVLSAPDLIDIYGLTETGTCDFFALPEDFRAQPGSIGRAAPQVRYRIAEPDAEGVGELQLRSPFVMRGYLDDAELTRAAFDGDWFRTGDLALELGDGRVALRGRTKDLISRGGNKVTPAEVELAIGTHPAVAAVLVAGMPDEVLGERISALVVPREGVSLTESDLREHLRDRLERFKQPDFIAFADELPVGRTGKADRTAVRAMFHAEQRRSET